MQIKKFKPIHLLLLSINGMIGSAWLFGAFYTARAAGPAAILSWLIGGLIVLTIAFCFAEISSSFPVTGGMARLPFITHGSTASFILCFIAWLSCVAMPAIEMQATLQYLSFYFPSLTTTIGGSKSLTQVGIIWAALLVLLLALLNQAPSKGLIRAHQYFSSIKVSIMVLVIIALFAAGHHWNNLNTPEYGWMPMGWHGTFSAIATGGIAFSFIGFRHSIDLAGESRNPSKGIPLAVIGSIVFCLILYILLQIAFSIALPSSQLDQGWSGIHFNGNSGPLIALSNVLGLTWLIGFILANAVISPMGAGLTYVTSSARMCLAMSQNNQLPKFLQNLNRHQMPANAIFFNASFSIMLFYIFRGWQSMVSFLVSAIVIAYSLAPICLISLRQQYPAHKRQFKLSKALIFAPLAFIFCSILSYWTGWQNMKILLIASTAGLCFYIAYQKIFKRNEEAKHWKNALWVIIYILGLCAISYAGNYGGGHAWLPNGIDLLSIALFSIIIFYWAVKSTRAAPDLDQFLSKSKSDDFSI